MLSIASPDKKNTDSNPVQMYYSKLFENKILKRQGGTPLSSRPNCNVYYFFDGKTN